MKTILVTGGTGSVGRPTVQALRAAGHTDLRILSRRPGVGHVRGDLTAGEGIAEALEGVSTVMHLATSRRRADVRQTENLLKHAEHVEHLIVISIVGIDRIPWPYYRDKLAVEQLVAESSIPFTLLRATQFHTLIDEVMTAQRFLPALLAPSIALQPVAVEDVAERLTELAAGPPSGRVKDLGGPEQLAVPAMARAWKQATHSRRPVVPIRLPGKTMRAFTEGFALSDPIQPTTRTFADYLAQHYGAQA
ncbi:NAD(P)H-binding protein [Kribbella sp. NPDC006257]|uniref:SDR family oxidoreductase n=1 Tax=Kribbella sp. NPDC006257 TaxID=3156738 RepID=UPI00339FD48D